MAEVQHHPMKAASLPIQAMLLTQAPKVVDQPTPSGSLQCTKGDEKLTCGQTGNPILTKPLPSANDGGIMRGRADWRAEWLICSI